MKTTLSLIIIAIITRAGFCQNLVLNPSFEIRSDEFKNNIEFKGVESWKTLDNSETFYLSETLCKAHPEKCFGFTGAKSGEVSAGAIFYQGSSNNTYQFSYLQGKLKRPLKKGEIYEVSFYYKLADSANASLRVLSVSLTPKRLGNYLDKSNKPWVLSETGKTNQIWQHFSKNYIAIGGELVITIGYMGKNSNIYDIFSDTMDEVYWQERGITTSYHKRNYPRNTIYFIDDVSIKKTNQIDEFGRVSSIYFKNNSVVLPANSQEKLNKLFKLKASNLSNYNIVVEGFADQNGEATDNDILSQKRAKSVADYLINKGMPSDRIEIKSYGESLAKGIDDISDRRVDIFLKARK